MSLIQSFNALNGKNVTRDSLIQLKKEATAQKNKAIASRISKLLRSNPDEKGFFIEIETPLKEKKPSSLVTQKKGEELHYLQEGKKVASLNKHGVITWHKRGLEAKDRYKIRKDAKIVGLGAAEDYEIEPVPEGFLHGLDYEEFEENGEGLGRVSPSDVYDLITAKVIEMVKNANSKEYKKKWAAKEYGKGYVIPFNFVTKKRYRGVNAIMLTELEPMENPFFLTFKQVNELKGKVKKGAKGYEVIYFTKIWKTEDKTKNLKFSSYDKAKVEAYKTENSIESELGVIPMLKYYHVYNGKDIEGIDFKLDSFKTGFIDKEKPSEESNRMPIPEAIINNYPKPQPTLKFGGDRAFYRPGADLVQMPHLADFETVQDYYRTLLHEYSHSTGAKNRLDRDFSGSFGSKKYAFEELVAELGAIFLSAEAGIIWHNNKNHAAYLKSWNSVLTQIQEDNKFIMKASTAAQKIADFVLQFDDNGDPLYFKDFKKTLEPKPVENQPTEKDTSEKNENYSFSADDIPYEVAYRAYTGISFSPEKRAISEQKNYFEFLKAVYDENFLIATKNDKLELFHSNFEVFQKGYLKRTLDYLRSKHGIFSTMIAGPAKFPVARMEKRNRIANDKLNELLDYGEKGQKRILQNITLEVDKPIKTGVTGTLKVLYEKLAEAEKIHKRNLEGNKLLKKLRANKEAKLQEYIDGFVAIGFDPETAKKEANYVYNYKYAGFFTTNSNAKVKRIKEQIALEEKLQKNKEEKGNTEYIFDQGSIVLNRDINRIQILFNEKPNEETRSALKKGGLAFRWSPKEMAWQRQLNTFGQYEYSSLWKLFPSLKESMQKSKTETKEAKHPKGDVESNPKGFAIKPKSVSVTSAIKDVLTLEKFNKAAEMVSGMLFKYFKEEIYLQDSKEVNLSQFEDGILSKESILHTYFKYDDESQELTLTSLGEDFILSVRGRLESLNNQKNNLSFFDGLKVPVTNSSETVFEPVQETYSEPINEPKQEKVNLPLNINSLAYRRQNRANATHEYYKIDNPNISNFLGKIEKKKKDSVAITLAGGQGSGKTSFVFQLINEFAKNYKVGHASIEEHPESALYENKAERFWNENAKATVDSPEINSLDDIHELILRNDVIVIDSYSKLLSMDRKITLDDTFRKKYDGKLFIIIYQLTSDGSMRGGTSSQFDGDVILFVEKFPNFNDNYVFADKNRYQEKSLDELHYNIATAKLIQPETQNEPTENLQFTDVEII